MSARRVPHLIKSLGIYRDAVRSSRSQVVKRISEQLRLDLPESWLGQVPWAVTSLPLRVALTAFLSRCGSALGIATTGSADAATKSSMPTGQRQMILGMDVGASEDCAFWLAFLRSLVGDGGLQPYWTC